MQQVFHIPDAITSSAQNIQQGRRCLTVAEEVPPRNPKFRSQEVESLTCFWLYTVGGFGARALKAGMGM